MLFYFPSIVNLNPTSIHSDKQFSYRKVKHFTGFKNKVTSLIGLIINNNIDKPLCYSLQRPTNVIHDKLQDVLRLTP